MRYCTSGQALNMNLHWWMDAKRDRFRYKTFGHLQREWALEDMYCCTFFSQAAWKPWRHLYVIIYSSCIHNALLPSFCFVLHACVPRLTPTQAFKQSDVLRRVKKKKKKICFYDIHCKWANFTKWTLWTWVVMLPPGCVNELFGPCNTLASSSYRSGPHVFRGC